MSIISQAIADFHNSELNKWKKKFEECKTFEEFQEVLLEFKKVEYSE